MATIPGSDFTGTIVATSLGIPTSPFTQSSRTTSGPAVQPPLINSIAPTSSPGMTSPLPTLPPIQIPTIPALNQSQARGLNSRHLLKELFDNDHKGGGGACEWESLTKSSTRLF
jgi:hypothetical protein